MPERGSKTPTVPVVWASFGIFSARSKWFRVAISDHGQWLYHCDPETKQWSGGIADQPAPKIPSAKIRWKSSRLDFLVSRRHPPHWLSSKGPNCQLGVLLISAGAIEGYFEGKTPRVGQQGGRATQKKLAYLDYQCLDHPPYSPDLAPSDYHLFPGLKKKKKRKVAIFRPTRRSLLLPRRPGWTDSLLNFFSGLQKLQQRAKEFIELERDVSSYEYGSLHVVLSFFCKYYLNKFQVKSLKKYVLIIFAVIGTEGHHIQWGY